MKSHSHISSARQNGDDSSEQNLSLDSNAVSKRAYELWQNEGSPHGQDRDHWFRAEQELKGRTRTAGVSQTPQSINRDVDRGKVGSGE